MSRQYTITTEGEEALAAATAETVVQARGTTATKAKCFGFGVSMDSTSASAEPALVQVMRQTTDGTASAATEAKWDADDPAAGVTGFHTFTAEPTSGEVLREFELHPTGVPYSEERSLGREWVMDDAATSRIGIKVTAPAAVNVTAWLDIEE